MNRYIALDVETGGIGDDKSLLTACFLYCQYDEKIDEYEIIDGLDLKIKPNDDVYHVTAQGMQVNGINLVEHDKVAVTEKQAGTKLYNKLSLWYIQNNKEKMIPIGHNVAFDIRCITNKLIHLGTWDQFTTYKTLDTCTIAQFLRLKNKLPHNLSCGLVSLTEHFNVKPMSGRPHEADYDCLATLNVLENLMKL